jgi:hypothetical protein
MADAVQRRVESGQLPVISATNGRSASSISPTDVAQFIRLDQCERYLNLRLRERAAGRGFLFDYGVVPQSLPPLLTRSGAEFEQRIERAIAARFPTRSFAASSGAANSRPESNAAVVTAARTLAPGEVRVLFQARLHVTVGAWLLRGDIDILRMERDATGALRLLIADMKSSAAAKVEHRLQVAFYHEMLATLLAAEGVANTAMEMAILYRGPRSGTARLTPEELAEHERQRRAAEAVFGVSDALLELTPDPQSYLGSVRDLVTAPRSVAARVTAAEFDALPFHLTAKCDGCLYNEFCMKWSAEHDDLSLLPQLTASDKAALQRCGVRATRELAALKAPDASEGTARDELVVAPGAETLVERLATTWPVGPRLDELIHRARRYRQWKGDPIAALWNIPTKGYGSLPYCDAEHNPNLVRVYIDAQHDYLQDRLYLLGSLVVASEGGVERPERRRSIVRMTDGPPESAEREERLLLDWIAATLRAVVELAAVDERGAAPIHLIFFDRGEQRVLLDALARHFARVVGATPLYDFLTQLAAFDSPLVTFLDAEIRALKNYPMVCQSLQAVAANLKFDWNTPAPYRELFRTRLFDFWGKLNRPSTGPDGTPESPWYTNRARFSSQIPLEYAYAAWADLGEQETAEQDSGQDDGESDELTTYRGVTRDLLLGFQARRLEALEHIAKDFAGNKQTEKRPFVLPDLASFQDKARSLAQALDEFVTIERHVELGEWKSTRLAAPERRVLSGDTLLVRYREVDQDVQVATANRENARRAELKERYRAEYLAAKPDAKQVRLSAEQRKAAQWSPDGLCVRMRLEAEGQDCALEEMLGLSELREGERVVIYPRWTEDGRLPPEQRAPFTPTPRQMLYGSRGEIARIVLKRDTAGTVTGGYVELELKSAPANDGGRGFLFAGIDRPLVDGALYTLDPDPNNIYGYWCAQVVKGTAEGQPNTLYARLTDPDGARVVRWPREAAEAQAHFLTGLDALFEADALHGFEPSKREYIGGHGEAPVLLVQGPPGTGKSYATGFAVYARLQGALAAGLDFRVVVSCKTHAATDVLLRHIAGVRERLRTLRLREPELFARHFDARILEVPLYRVEPAAEQPDGIIVLRRAPRRAVSGAAEGEAPPKEPGIYERLAAVRNCIVGAPPGKVYSLLKERFEKAFFGSGLAQCLILDEASQMNLPEAAMAALPLAEDGALIVVGDHRQMPPIVKHDWSSEPRRTFQEYRAYQSLFDTLLARQPRPPLIQFAESFRLHAVLAEFLRREVYQQDGIPYHSNQHELLPRREHADPFVASVLAPEYPLVVVVHDEAESMQCNPFEQHLLAPVLEALADPRLYGLGPRDGLGVVVPHRAQRAALRQAVPQLNVVDPATGTIVRSAVETVERFQGDERTVILVSATESDPQYLLAASEFLLDPRRLTVALSRAKRKMVLVASRSVFTLFSPDEETFAHAQLWKDLLARTCTVPLWAGERAGRRVEVWGNASPSAAASTVLAAPRAAAH